MKIMLKEKIKSNQTKNLFHEDYIEGLNNKVLLHGQVFNKKSLPFRFEKTNEFWGKKGIN